MKTMTLEETTATAQELVDIARDEPVILREASGQAYALHAIDELDVEAWVLGHSPSFNAMLDRAYDEAEATSWLTTDQVRKELGLDERV